MADPILVLLIVTGLTASDRPRGSVVQSAIASALSDDARVLVEERTVSPSDAEVISIAERVRSSAVAGIAWSNVARSRVHLHIYLAADHSFYDRDLSFEPTDALEDRERAVGLVIGSTVQASQPPPPESRPLPAAPPAMPSSRDHGADVSPAPPWPRLGADIGGIVTAGIAGSAGSFGPALRARIRLDDAISLHAGVSIGFGTLAAAEATTTTTRIPLGARWQLVAFGSTRSAGLDVGIEALAVRQVVRRATPEATRDRWLLGAHVDAGIVWHLTRAVAPFATVGVDGLSGATPVNVAEQTVAQLPPFRVVGEAGLRIFF